MAGGRQVPTCAVCGHASVYFCHEVLTSHMATDLGHLLRSAFAITKCILILIHLGVKGLLGAPLQWPSRWAEEERGAF